MCDYLKFLRQNSNLKPKVIRLSSNIETITAISNDMSYEKIFKYQADLFEKNDLLIIISSSGNSKNIKEVLKFAKKRRKTIGFSGFKGGFFFKKEK